MTTLETKLVSLFDFYSHFSSGFGTDSGTQLEEDCKPIKVEDADGRHFVKLERVDEVVPQLEDEAEKLYRMLDVTKAGLSNYHNSILMNQCRRSLLLPRLGIPNQLG